MTNNKRIDIPLNIQTIGIIVAALGSIAALISAWIQIAPGKPELEARITSIEEFSSRPKIEGLVGDFTYEGEKIDRLVTLRATIINSGNKTIIGQGVQKNIIGEALSVDVPSEIKIVNAIFLSNDLNAELSNEEKSILINFSQWRPTEAVELLLYLKAGDVKITDYLVKKERDIIDGDFRIVNAIYKNTGKNPLVDYLPSGYVKGLKAFGYLSLVVMFPLCIMLMVEAIKAHIQASNWKKVNLNGFSLFVNEKLSFLPEEEQEQLKSDPELLNNIMWKQYDGEKHPTTVGGSLGGAFMVAAVFLLISLGCLPLFVALHYLY